MRKLGLIALSAILSTFSAHAQETTNIWRGTLSQDWFTDGNWSLAVVPAAGMQVLITNPAGNQALLTNSTPLLAGLVISNSSLTCSNWFTTINATNVAILGRGRMTLPYPFVYTNEPSGLTSNRIRIACTNLLIETGGEINADGKGYLVANGPGKAPSSGASNNNGGGGHGGRGGDETQTTTSGGAGVEYGSTNAPMAPGSGGARWASSPYPTTNGCGGGAIRIEAANVTVNGAVLARGVIGAPYDGGGAGGSVYITCSVFAGTNGVIRVDGGNGGANYGGGGAGGGRIALSYTTLANDPSVRFSASAGPLFTLNPAGMGTLHLPDAGLITASTIGRLFDGVRLIVPGWNAWAPDSLLLTSNSVCLGESGFTLTVTNDVVIQSNGWLTVGGKALSSRWALGSGGRGATNPVVSVGGSLLLAGSTLTLGGLEGDSLPSLTVGGSLVLTNAGAMPGYLVVNGGWTNPAAGLTNGALLSVAGSMLIGTNSWMTPVSHPTNGGSPLLRSGSLTIQRGGGINADFNGFRVYPTVAYGPGAGISSGNRAGGGSYGGPGGKGSSAGAFAGPTYGHAHYPVDPGSPGAFGYTADPGRGFGGGLIRIESGDVTINGTLSASGSNSVNMYGGGGSGGGIFILCDSFSGAGSGVMRANGGNAHAVNSGAGGGGRVGVAVGLSPSEREQLLAGETIANLNVYTNWASYTGALQVLGGVAFSNGSPGTLAFLKVSATKDVFITGVPGNYGAPTPNPYGFALNIPNNAWFTNSVASPADESNGLRRACTGWRADLAAGGYLTSADTTQAVFQVTNNMNLTWFWTNEYRLAASAGPGGSVNTASNGWHRQGAEVGGLAATPDPDQAFLCWTGDLPIARRFDNPLTVVMDQPRAVGAVFYSTLTGTQRVWTGAGRWYFDPTNWTPNGLPGPLDSVEIRSGQALLDSPASLDAFVISNGATLVFSNWNTTLTVAQSLLVKSNATVKHAGPYTYLTQMSNRVSLVCGSLTIERFGKIDASAVGYFSATGPGRGYGGGSNDGTGAGHGGRGGSNANFTATLAGVVYGSSNAPTGPGSGGGGGYTDEGYFGKGGGAVLIQAEGGVVVDGSILANAQNGGVYWGGGAGGSILILCGAFSGGTGAVISAAGGARGSGYPTYLGGGGGGRIAIGRRFTAGQRAQLLAGALDKLSYETGNPAYLGATNAAGGLGGRNGQDGTIVFMKPVPPAGTVILVY
jgi:hypothetical protein